MNRNGALGLLASGAILVLAALFLLPVDGLSLIAGAVGVLGILALVYGGIVYRRSRPIAPTRDELIGGVAIGMVFVIIGIIGSLGGPPSPSSAVFTIGGLALLISAVIRYRRASRNGRGSASDG